MENTFDSSTKAVTVRNMPVTVWRRCRRMALSQNLTIAELLALMIQRYRLTESEEQ